MDAALIQQKIFDQVKSQITHKKWIDEIAALLGRSKNSIYKKLTGEIGLSLEELALLSTKYNIYIDPIIQEKKVVSFDFPFLQQEDKVILNYFDSLSELADHFTQHPDLKVWMSQMEIPFLHDYNFPEITAFKFFIHEKTIWRSEKRMTSKFSLEKAMQKPGLKQILNRLLLTYYKIPSVEFWHSLILDITLAQIKYIVEINAFEDPLDALVLCERLLDFVNHMQFMADVGKKFPVDSEEDFDGAEFILYHNEVAHSNNIIFLETKAQNSVFLSFGNPNFLFTSGESVIEYSKKWFEVLKENSQLITRESRKSRLAFFNELRKKIDNTMLEITTLRKLQKL